MKMKMKMSWKGCNASVLQVVGDDLLMSNPKCIEKVIGELTCNALLLKEIMVLPTGANSLEEAMQMGLETYHYLKVNQIGTVIEAIEAVKLAKYVNWGIVVPHRCGETVDSFIADLIVGLATC
ncbi:hypothetical protein GIB67_020554 [Kingdonia uniflora]|uniref:phosphopyruvate hydratase n=1 Tax=Kingdonia uniflora TaxID=39325 RepID=A0A7J7NLW5_9MAGN|nr:hypothetical protein GIB67_020554 [Kingdonia uniflora]